MRVHLDLSANVHTLLKLTDIFIDKLDAIRLSSLYIAGLENIRWLENCIFSVGDFLSPFVFHVGFVPIR